MPHPHEISVGAVIFRLEKKEPYYLLLHYPKITQHQQNSSAQVLAKKEIEEDLVRRSLGEGGHWDFPKGHMEKGEDIYTTLRREVNEETGITKITIHPAFKQKVHYWYMRSGKRYFKEVIYLVVQTEQKNITLSFEHIGYEWLTYQEALMRITYAQPKKVIEQAHSFILKTII